MGAAQHLEASKRRTNQMAGRGPRGFEDGGSRGGTGSAATAGAEGIRSWGLRYWPRGGLGERLG